MPEPGPGQVRVRVSVCGVCRTDLHLAEGDLAPRHARDGARPRGGRPGRPAGPRVHGRSCEGERIGIPWLARTCGVCRFCLADRENLCTAPAFTGWDVDGGYAEYAVVDERYAYRLPDGIGDLEAAPLLCAGIIGYRALRRAELPSGGPPRDLRVRRVGAPDGAGGPGRGRDRPRDDEVRRRPPPRPRARRRQCAGGRRPAPRAARRRHPLRPGRDPGAAGPRGPRTGRHPGDRRHPPVRHPGARLPAPPLRGADAPQRHGQHPHATAGSSWPSPPTSASGCRRCRIPSTGPTGRWPTWPTTGSTGPRSWWWGVGEARSGRRPLTRSAGPHIGYNDVTE